jgi:hypothetical protein
MMSTGWTPQIKQVVEELRSSGDTHITYLKLKPCSGKELGIASHPTADAYISRGDAIIELIEQLTGWKAGEAPEIPETTTAPETEAPVVTEAPAITEAPATTGAPAVTEPAPEKNGCGASAVSAAAVIGAVATAVALKKKRDEE